MRRLPRIACAIATLVTLSCSAVSAQQRVGVASQIDTARPIDTGGFHMTKSPLEAVLLSAAIPGLGQVYLDQTWKLPFIVGLFGGFLYGEQIQNFRYHYTSDTINNAFARANGKDSAWAFQNIPVREFYRDDRDKFWIYMGITYLATILDAYIAANLYDFDVSDPGTHVSSYFDPVNRRVGMSFSLRF